MSGRSKNYHINDRHIPIRSVTTDKDFHKFSEDSQAQTNYTSMLAMGSARTKSNPKVLNYCKLTAPNLNAQQTHKKGILGFIAGLHENKRAIPKMEIQSVSQEVRLDAPELSRSFYYQTLDVSKSGTLGVILGNQINLYNNSIGSVIPRHRTTQFSSLKFSLNQFCLYAGDLTGNIQIYNLQNNKIIRRIHESYVRYGVIETIDQNTFLAGCQWKDIFLMDQRIQNAKVATFSRHQAEVCGLSMNRGSNGKYFASGGIQGQVLVWDLRRQICVSRIKEFTGAVKALKWSPLRYNYLYGAGGQGNKEIVVWNQNQSIVEKRIIVEESTTGIQFNQKRNWMITSHNISSIGSLKVWDLRTDRVIRQSKCKKMKILTMAIDPSDQRYVWTADHRETVRAWNIAPKRDSSMKQNKLELVNRQSSKLNCSLR